MVITTEVDNQSAIDFEIYRGQGTEILNPQLIDIITLEGLPESRGGDVDVVVMMDKDTEDTCSINLSVASAGLNGGKTIDLRKEPGIIDVKQYAHTGAEITSTHAEQVHGEPINEDFVSGIDQHVSYDRRYVRRTQRKKRRVRILSGLYIPLFLIYLLSTIGILLFLAVILYLGTRIPPMPSLNV